MKASLAKCLLLLSIVGTKLIAALSKIYSIFSQFLTVLLRNMSKPLQEEAQGKRSRSTFTICKRTFKQQIYRNGSQKYRQKYHQHRRNSISIRLTLLLSLKMSVRSTNWHLSRVSLLRLHRAKERHSMSMGNKGWLATTAIWEN